MIEFVLNRIGSTRAIETDASPPNGVVRSSPSLVDSIPLDTSLNTESQYSYVFPPQQLEEWTTDDVHEFFRGKGLEKFISILPENIDGSDLMEVYLIHKNNRNELLKLIQKANSEINLKDYLNFVKSLKILAKEK